MTWTSQKPTQAGWHWLLTRRGMFVVHISIAGENLVVEEPFARFFDERYVELYPSDAVFWSGPIAPPTSVPMFEARPELTPEERST